MHMSAPLSAHPGTLPPSFERLSCGPAPQMARVLLPLLLLLLPPHAAAHGAPLLRLVRLRGGALSREEIVDKLNKVPTFAIVNGRDQIVPMRDPDLGSGAEDICFFCDAAEAKELLELTLAANPEATDLQLAVTPLGNAFLRCHGFPDGPEDETAEGATARSDEAGGYAGGAMRLCGPRSVVAANAEVLREQQRAQDVTPGAWVLPAFCHDDFQIEGKLMPFFFSPEDFAAGWTRSGRDADAIPTNLAVMDLRVLVKQMLHTEAFDWSIFQFVSSEEAYALASQLLARKQTAAAAERDSEDDGYSEEDEGPLD